MPAPADLVPEQQLRESYVKHAVRAQLYRLLDRWAQSGDDPRDLGDLIDGAAPAHPFLQRAGGQLAACRIDLDHEGGIELSAAFDGGATLTALLDRGTAFLPRFRSVASDCDMPSALPISATYRASAAVHYFIALVENPARDPEPFFELLADRFSLHYTAVPVTDAGALRSWVTGRLASVVASEHDIHNIICTDLGNGRYTVEVTMKSQALFPDGAGAISRNKQLWTMIDEPGWRFPRITEILIDRDAVEFFGPAPAYEPRPLPG